MYRGFFVVLACFFSLFLSPVTNESQAACSSQPVRINGNFYPSVTTIQAAYDYASGTLSLQNFTLQLSGEIFTENLDLNGGNVTFDGGYDDCTFTTKTSTTGMFGTVTIGSGSAIFAGGVGVVSTDQ